MPSHMHDGRFEHSVTHEPGHEAGNRSHFLAAARASIRVPLRDAETLPTDLIEGTFLRIQRGPVARGPASS